MEDKQKEGCEIIIAPGLSAHFPKSMQLGGGNIMDL